MLVDRRGYCFWCREQGHHSVCPQRRNIGHRAALACFGVFSLPYTFAASRADQSDKPDFNGIWTLDLKASASLEPIMKKVGARFLEQTFASRTNLKATIRQTEQVITVATRGRGLDRPEVLCLSMACL
jgi:hypothetical protein